MRCGLTSRIRRELLRVACIRLVGIVAVLLLFPAFKHCSDSVQRQCRARQVVRQLPPLTDNPFASTVFLEMVHHVQDGPVSQQRVSKVDGVDKPPDRSGSVSSVLVLVAFTAVLPIDPSGQMPNLSLLDDLVIVRLEIARYGP